MTLEELQTALRLLGAETTDMTDDGYDIDALHRTYYIHPGIWARMTRRSLDYPPPRVLVHIAGIQEPVASRCGPERSR